MKSLARALSLNIVLAMTLVACSSTTSTTTTTTTTHRIPASNATTVTTVKKEATTVSLLTNNPARPYQILGQTKISKFNDEGLKRQEATVRDLMRQDAASLGGDAIIDVQHGSHEVTGTVIAYKQILV